MLNEGMKVSVCDINENVGKNFPEDILEDQKNKVVFCKCDVSSESEFRAAFDKTIKTFGRIDLLINNAGILNEHEWKRVIDVNFVGVINGIHLAFEYMGIDKGGCGGTVINTGSNAAFEPIPLAPVYSGCKHGVIGLTRNYG
ncbi:15-hydroxyprostaglandin dehydrogenase [NAD(+)], partial [Stegodyphus mimosarum]